MAKKICTLCDKPQLARGFCQMHYRRWYRHGDPSVQMITDRSQVRQEAVYQFIEKFIQSHQYPPTYQEISKGLKLSSASLARKYVQALVKRGRVRHIKGSPRAITLVK